MTDVTVCPAADGRWATDIRCDAGPVVCGTFEEAVAVALVWLEHDALVTAIPPIAAVDEAVAALYGEAA